jgi:hypothetical protein
VDVRANQAWSETNDGMRIDWDVPIETDDELVLRADARRRRPVSRDPWRDSLWKMAVLPGRGLGRSVENAMRA